MRILYDIVYIMAIKMGIRELRDSLPATIKRVQSGETIEVTNHGTTVALLTSVPADRVGQLVASGIVSAGAPLAGPLRRYPVTGNLSASQALEDERADH